MAEKEFSVIGKPTPMIDAPEKVRGAAEYAPDIVHPRMLIGKVLRSPHAHARIRQLDSSRARRLPGVKAVLTIDDIPQVKWGHENNDQTTLAKDKVRFVGEEVAAVAAVDEATALEALELIEVAYEPLPYVLDPVEALEPGAPLLHEEWPGNLAWETRINRGDVEAGFREAAAVYEDTFRTTFQYQAFMEPIGSVASVDSTGKVTVWASTQAVYFTRSRIAKSLGVPESRVRVIQPYVGGGFGGKLNDEPNAQICALLAVATGRPVKLINTRTEEFLASRPRVPAVVHIKAGVRKDGTICAKDSDIISDNGAYTGRGAKIMNVTAMRIDNAYRMQNVRARARLAYTNKLPSGAFRGLGNPQKIFPFESALDHLAEQIGMDPVEIRLVNAIQQGETSVHGWKMGSCGLAECIKFVSQSSGIRKNRERAIKGGAKRRGIGIADAIHVSGNRHYTNWDGASATVKMNQDGRVNLIISEGDIGQGASTVLSLICAEEMGLRLPDIEVSKPDTDLTPICMGAFASRVTLVAGNAVKKAAAQARLNLLEAAGELMEVDPVDLDIREGVISVRGVPERQMSIPDVCKNGLFRQGGDLISVSASVDNPTEMADESRYGNVSPGYTFCSQAAEVEVDTETGQVEVVGFWVADDVGRTINPLTAEGQIQGAVMQGMGFAIYENWFVDAGQVMNGNFADYTLPKASCLPRKVESALVETIEPNGPFGAKGASETAIDPVAAAIGNAIYDAIGVRITSLPFTPEKILAAMAGKEKSAGGAF
ncbi:MAG: xanthine dehydrogenase family protein molybdopterin-binding subunit [Nitrospinota bacterium]